MPARIFAAAAMWSLAASTGASAQGLEHACGIPARSACGGCAVSCPVTKFAVCRAGLSIWRGSVWMCSYQPLCACQQTLWTVWR
jgi:hypothetical protein